MAVSPHRRLGNLAEKAFEYELIERDFDYAIPYGDHHPFDIIVIARDRLLKVQIKSTHKKRIDNRKSPPLESYHVSVNHQAPYEQTRGRVRYKPGMFDILAATVMPEHAWYIISAVDVIHLSDISLYAGIPGGGRGNTRRWEQYLNRWDLLQ